MFKDFMKESCKSMIWISTMIRELVHMLCEKVHAIANED